MSSSARLHPLILFLTLGAGTAAATGGAGGAGEGARVGGVRVERQYFRYVCTQY